MRAVAEPVFVETRANRPVRVLSILGPIELGVPLLIRTIEGHTVFVEVSLFRG